MAKVSYNKLNKVKSFEPVSVIINDYYVDIQQYLPIEEKLALMERVINQAGSGEEGFYNIVKLDVYYTIEMIRAYTNISFTEKQLEDIPKLYDSLRYNDIWAQVVDNIPQEERAYIWNNVENLAREVTNYNHSALGVIKTMAAQRDQLNFNVEEIMGKINDPEALALLKEMVNLTGIVN